ncbi:hypothetical protein EV421DRAFT_1748760 [Armillaria borealis]|uniref:Uncharacterized protein n=1 Tax=Armillaria borealis TaxID=47425 RepID=A0AA39I032_9AGAR|nr:hypothetical protein EV421DRAFT_1748760 [Armillaria borealis]
MSEEPQSDAMEVESDSEDDLETTREINIMLEDDASREIVSRSNRFGNVDIDVDATTGLVRDALDDDAMDSDFDDYGTPSPPFRRDVDLTDPFGWSSRDDPGRQPSSNDTIDLEGLFGVLQGVIPPRSVETPPPELEPSLPVTPVALPVPARLLTDQGTPMGASTDIYEPLPVEPDWSRTPPPDNQEFLHEGEHVDDETLGDHESPPDDRDQTS